MWLVLLLEFLQGISSKKRQRATLFLGIAFCFFLISLGLMGYGSYIYLRQEYGELWALGTFIIPLNLGGLILWRLSQRLRKDTSLLSNVPDLKGVQEILSPRNLASFYKEHRFMLLLGLTFLGILGLTRKGKDS